MKALYIGRFQPFHKGHLKIINNISKKFDEIIIGIGSSQYSNASENPFSSEERKEMIKKTLDKMDINNYKIIFIPDIHNPPKWVEHVKSIISDFDFIITNNSFTKKLFLEKGYEVYDTPLYNKEKFSGKEIRNRMINDDNWEKLVPEEVKNYIINIDGIKRLKKI
jgi:nicotinamide-nucleotide adenylyltransferase